MFNVERKKKRAAKICRVDICVTYKNIEAISKKYIWSTHAKRRATEGEVVNKQQTQRHTIYGLKSFHMCPHRRTLAAEQPSSTVAATAAHPV